MKAFELVWKKIMVVLILLASNNCFAQMDATFNSFLKESHIEFTSPKGFTDLDSIFNIKIKRGHRPHQLFYSQINYNSDLAIGYMINNASKGIEAGRRKEFTFINYIKSTINEQSKSAQVLTKKELRRVNADDGLIYDYDTLSNAYKGFNKCRVLILYNEIDGVGTVYYFYNDGSEDKVKALMKETSSILKFKTRRHHHSTYPITGL